MEEYNKFLQQSLEYKKAREDRYKDVSRDRLFRVAKKKIETTMIGALSTIEEYFGFLWGFNDADEARTPEQKHLRDIYDEARAKILDRGNTQIRNLESELVNYDISRKKHFITMPVIPQAKGETNDGKEVK